MEKKKFNTRRRSQSLRNLTHYFSSSSDGSDDSDLEKCPHSTNSKKIFRNPGRQQIPSSIITRNLNEFVSSTPLNSVRKTFNRTLTLSPIGTQEAEPIALRTRLNLNSLQLQDDNSKPRNLKQKKTNITGIKRKSNISKVIFPVENTGNVYNSVLATNLELNNTFEKFENDAEGAKNQPLQSNNNVSARSNIWKTRSTHAQTSLSMPLSTLSELQNRFTQTVADKEIRIADLLERYSTAGSSKSKRLRSKATDEDDGSRDNDETLTSQNCIEDNVGNFETSGNSGISVTHAKDQCGELYSWLTSLLNSHLEDSSSDTSDKSRFSEEVNSDKGKELVVVLERLEDTLCKIISNQKRQQTNTTVPRNSHIESSLDSFDKCKNKRNTQKNKSNVSQNIQNISRGNLRDDILESNQEASSIFTTQKEVLNKSIIRNQQNDDNWATNIDHQGTINSQLHVSDIKNYIESMQKKITSKRKKIRRKPRSLQDIADYLLSSKIEKDTHDVSETHQDNCLRSEAVDISHPVKRSKTKILDNHTLNNNACTHKTTEKNRKKRTNNPAPEVTVTDTHDVSETHQDNCLRSEAVDISHPVKRSKTKILDNHTLNNNACTHKTTEKNRKKRTNNPAPEVTVTDTHDVSETHQDNCSRSEALSISHPVKRPKINILDNHILKSNTYTDKTTEKNRRKRTNDPVPEVIVTEHSQEVSEDGLRRSRRQRKPRGAGYVPGVLLMTKRCWRACSKENLRSSNCTLALGSSTSKDSRLESKTSVRNILKKGRQPRRRERKVNDMKSSSKPKEENEMITDSRKNRENYSSVETSESNSEQCHENNPIEDVITEETNEDIETTSNTDYVNNSQIGEIASDLTGLGRSLPRKTKLEDTSSNAILRDYFYFPQNNAVRRVAWCFSDPPLKVITQRLRIAIGPKSLQAGFQSGFLEIQPGTSKPKDMAVKFSLVFVVLEGSGLFHVHDSYSIVGHSTIVYVPLGAYYLIENRSQTERLLLHYVQIKSHP